VAADPAGITTFGSAAVAGEEKSALRALGERLIERVIEFGIGCRTIATYALRTVDVPPRDAGALPAGSSTG
jgi:hypothetical protein